MKIRQGFVSNSSSSSFYIRIPDEELHFKDIPEYYGINTELPEDVQAWMQMFIWAALKADELKKKEETDPSYIWDPMEFHYRRVEDSDYDYDAGAKEYLKEHVSDRNIQWYAKHQDYYKLPEGYWDKAKVLANSPVTMFEVEDHGEPVFEEVKAPYEIQAAIRDNAYDMFTKPDKAIGIKE